MARLRTTRQAVYRLIPAHLRGVALVLALILAGATIGLYAPAAFGQSWDSPLLGPQQLAASPDAAAQIWPLLLTCAGDSTQVAADPFLRSELFFGSLKPDGTQVTEEEFQRFVDEEVTPRFPDGLTLLTGYGQFRNSQNVIIEETSRLLILLYPLNTRGDSSTKIEQIRDLYETRFQQESVLRSDDRLPVCVSF